jgi:hypothetical protein
MQSTDLALFAGRGNGLSNVNNSVTLNGLSFTGTQQYSIAFGASRFLTLTGSLSNSSTRQQIIGDSQSTTKGLIVGPAGLVINTGTAGILIQANGAGSSGNITKTGAGTLTINTSGAFSVGRITVSDGFVSAANAISGDVYVSSTTGGAFSSSGGVSQNLNVSSGSATVGGDVGATATISGGVTQIAGEVVGTYTQTGGTATVANGLGSTGSISAGLLNVRSVNDNFTQSGGVVDGLSQFLQNGTGVILNSGIYTQSSGSANLAGSTNTENAYINQTGGTIVFNRTTINGGSQTISGSDTTVTNTLGGNVSMVGSSPTDVGQNVKFVSNLQLLSTANVQLNFDNTNGTFNSDQLKTDAALTYGGTMALNLTTAGTAANYTQWTMFTFGSQTGNLDGVTLSSLNEPAYSGLGPFSLASTGNHWEQNYGAGVWLSNWSAGGQRFVFTQSTGILTVVPEPSTIVFAGIGMAMLGWHTWTRGRRNARMKLIEEHMRKAGEERGLI